MMDIGVKRMVMFEIVSITLEVILVTIVAIISYLSKKQSYSQFFWNMVYMNDFPKLLHPFLINVSDQNMVVWSEY
jgi:hypothetical protein